MTFFLKKEPPPKLKYNKRRYKLGNFGGLTRQSKSFGIYRTWTNKRWDRKIIWEQLTVKCGAHAIRIRNLEIFFTKQLENQQMIQAGEAAKLGLGNMGTHTMAISIGWYVSILHDSAWDSLTPPPAWQSIPRLLHPNSQSVYLHWSALHRAAHAAFSRSHHKIGHPVNQTVVVNYQCHSLCPFKHWAHNRGQITTRQHKSHGPDVPTYESLQLAECCGWAPTLWTSYAHARTLPRETAKATKPKQTAERVTMLLRESLYPYLAFQIRQCFWNTLSVSSLF